MSKLIGRNSKLEHSLFKISAIRVIFISDNNALLHMINRRLSKAVFGQWHHC